MLENAFFMASLLLSAIGEPVIPTEDLEARWRREYPRAVEEWRVLEREFSAKGHFSYRWNNGKTTITPELTVACSGDKSVFIRERNKEERPGYPDRALGSVVYIQTPVFQCKLRKASQSTHYIIEDYQKFLDNGESNFNYWYNKFARNATMYFGASLLERVRHPSFVLKSIEALNQGDDEFVRLGYTYEGKYVFESGVVDLEPARNWGIRSVDVTCTQKNNGFPWALEIEVEYAKVDNTHFFPNRMESFTRTPKPNVYSHAILELDRITLGKVPDDLFRMSTYQVPDIRLTPAPRPSIFTFRNPFFWLALAAALVSFVLLWFMRSRKDRAD